MSHQGSHIWYKGLCENEINRELFRHFIRRQEVTDCWRREDGKWVVKSDPFIDDWPGQKKTMVSLWTAFGIQ